MSAQAPPPGAPAGPAGAARRSSDAPSGGRTVIAQGTRVQGSVSGDDSLEVAGRLEGSARVKGLCHIAAEGSVKGDLTAASIVIDGRLEGRAVVADKVELGARAQVRADVHARIVAVAEGAVLDGQVHMGEGEPAAPITFKEKRKDRAAGAVPPAAPQPAAPAEATPAAGPEPAAVVPEPPAASEEPPPASQPEPAEPAKS